MLIILYVRDFLVEKIGLALGMTWWVLENGKQNTKESKGAVVSLQIHLEFTAKIHVTHNGVCYISHANFATHYPWSIDLAVFNPQQP